MVLVQGGPVGCGRQDTVPTSRCLQFVAQASSQGRWLFSVVRWLRQKKKKKNANVTRDSVSGWLSFGEVSRRGHSSCSHQWPIDVWAGLGMFLHPPRSVGWGGLGGGGEGALTPPPASPVCPATPAGRGRGDRGMGLMSAPHQARVTPSSSSPWSPGTSSPRWWPGPPSARGTSCTPSLMKPLTCT